MKLRPRRSAVLLLVALLCVAWPASRAQDDRRSSRPRTALVLSGGGARGAAHIGVLKVLEELAVPVDLVVGTSMGAVVGGLYASGLSPEEIETIFLGLDWKDVLTDQPPRQNISFRRKQDDNRALFQFELGVSRRGLTSPAGLVAGQKLGFYLSSLTLHTAGVDSFDALPLPFRAVATDLSNGEPVVLDHGSLADAIRASMAVPGAFTPVELEGRVLVDGGLVQNLPIAVALAAGAQRIIAVDVGSPLDELGTGASSVLGVAVQSVAVLTDQNVREQRALLRSGDLLVAPDLGDVESAEFARIGEAIALGEAEARSAVDELKRFAVTGDAFRRYLDRQRLDPGPGELPIHSVEVIGDSRVDPRVIRRRVRSRPGESLDLRTLQQDLQRIYQIGEFQQVSFNVIRADDGRNRLVIDARDKSWGPNYLRFGMALQADFEGQGDFTVLTDFTRTQVNRLGAEWKSILTLGDLDSVFTEFYQPLSYSGFLFVAPQLELSREQVEILGGKGQVTRARNDIAIERLDIGSQFRSYGELRLGYQRGKLDSEIQSGPGVETVKVELGAVRARLTLDRLDNANFPRRGNFGQLELLLSRDGLGATDDYDKLDLDWIQAKSIRRHTLIARLHYATSLETRLPYYDEFSLGGFLNLSGLRPGALRGNVLGHLTLAYYNQISTLPGPLGGGIYAGGALEAGNVWLDPGAIELGELRPAFLVFGGVDTLLGAVYLGYGIADSGDNSFYVFLGRPF